MSLSFNLFGDVLYVLLSFENMILNAYKIVKNVNRA